jgi:uncharacterized protein YndB with AHSA1/START domain
MAHAEHTVTIERPAEAVFDFVADGANNPRWRPTVIDIERANDAVGVGATWRQGMKGPGGRRIAGDYRITTSERPSRLAFEVISGPARPTGTFSFGADGPARTSVTFALDIKPTGMMRLMGPMIARQMQAEVAALDTLKAVLEG